MTTFPIPDWVKPADDEDETRRDNEPGFESFDSEDEVDGSLKRDLPDDDLDEIVLGALKAGLPYPGDAGPRRPERFSVGVSDRVDFYLVLDHQRDQALYVHPSRLRNASFDVGLWYATHCAAQTDVNESESASTLVARWQRGRQSVGPTNSPAFEYSGTPMIPSSY